MRMDSTPKYYSQDGSAARKQQAVALATPQQRRQGIAAVWKGFYDTYKDPAATLIQSYWRGYATRKRVHACKHGHLLHGVLPTQPAARDAAARVIQRYWRGCTVRQVAYAKRLAIVCIQQHWRGFAARKRFPALRAAWRWQNEAVLILQCAVRCWLARKRQLEAAALRHQAASHSNVRLADQAHAAVVCCKHDSSTHTEAQQEALCISHGSATCPAQQDPSSNISCSEAEAHAAQPAQQTLLGETAGLPQSSSCQQGRQVAAYSSREMKATTQVSATGDDSMRSRRYQVRLSQSLPRLPGPHAAEISCRQGGEEHVQCAGPHQGAACNSSSIQAPWQAVAWDGSSTDTVHKVPGQRPTKTVFRSTGTCKVVPTLRHVHSMPDAHQKWGLTATHLPTYIQHITCASVSQEETDRSSCTGARMRTSQKDTYSVGDTTTVLKIHTSPRHSSHAPRDTVVDQHSDTQGAWVDCRSQQQQYDSGGNTESKPRPTDPKDQARHAGRHRTSRQSIDAAAIPAHNTIHAQVMAVQPRRTLACSSFTSGAK